MTAARREPLVELDALTDQLPERAAALVAQLEQVLHGCPWCGLPSGTCRSTGGREPCEGAGDQAALMLEVEQAPNVHFGGC